MIAEAQHVLKLKVYITHVCAAASNIRTFRRKIQDMSANHMNYWLQSDYDWFWYLFIDSGKYLHIYLTPIHVLQPIGEISLIYVF